MSRTAFLAWMVLPAAACAAISLVAGSDSWVGLAAYIAEAPAAGLGGWLALRRMPTE